MLFSYLSQCRKLFSFSEYQFLIHLRHLHLKLFELPFFSALFDNYHQNHQTVTNYIPLLN